MWCSDKTKKDLSSSILGFNVFKKSNLSMTEPRHNKTLENATPREGFRIDVKLTYF